MVLRMAKTLVIAEKPSVGRDVARVLPGPFAKHEGYLEGPEHLISWAVGHLVQLAEPDEYDAKYKKWRMADLPIVPDRFKLVVRDERSKKQMSVVSKLLRNDEVDLVVNACDAGREGELIFAYLYEKAAAKKPVKRLWLNSMTMQAMREAFAHLRDASEVELLEAAARSRSEADWIVGMNATRAAQRLYEEHKALTYPRTSSRYLTSDMVAELKPTAEQVGRVGREYAQAAAYVTGLDLLPLSRVVDDEKVGDHHAIIPTNAQHVLERMNEDDRKVYDLVARRFLAVFHPEAVFEHTRVETTVAEHIFRTRGQVLVEAGVRCV